MTIFTHKGGALGVVIIIVGNGPSDPNSKPGGGCLYFKWH